MRALVAAILIAASTSCASAQFCTPLADRLAEIDSVVPIAKQVTLTKEQLPGFLAWLKGPPDIDLVVVLSHKDGRTGVLLGTDGDVCMDGLLEPAAVPGMMQAIEGKGPPV